MTVFYPNMPPKQNPPAPIVTLTTDFGLSDAYVAAMKGAILRQTRNVLLIDVTHGIPPGDILCGSINLERAIDGFGEGVIHLAVVDPGVGSDRGLLIAEIAGAKIICPDNGLITWAWRRLGGGKAYRLHWRPKKHSDTFHGRDVMAPVAGMLAAGSDISEFAKPIADPVLLDIVPETAPARKGRVIHIDHFGNATTNIPRESIRETASRFSIRVGLRNIGRLKRTYWDAIPGKPLALFGSAGLLEIAVRDGSAAEKLSLKVGDEVGIV